MLLGFVCYVLFLYIFVMFKASWPKFCNIIFLFVLKVGLVGPLVQQLSFTLVFPLIFIYDHFYITIIQKSIFFKQNITSPPYLKMLQINMVTLLLLFFLIDRNVRCCFLQFVEAFIQQEIFILKYFNCSQSLQLSKWQLPSIYTVGTQVQIWKS